MITITVDGRPVEGAGDQTVAGLIMASGELQLRRTTVGDRPRGVFCGIGVCFDCMVTVNGIRDVRACRRQAQDGDVVETQHDELPPEPRVRAHD